MEPTQDTQDQTMMNNDMTNDETMNPSMSSATQEAGAGSSCKCCKCCTCDDGCDCKNESQDAGSQTPNFEPPTGDMTTV